MTACMIKSKSGGAVVALLCLSVFLLVLSARLSVYESTHRSHGTNHQVLISDQKMEVGSFKSCVPPLLLAVILFVLWHGLKYGGRHVERSHLCSIRQAHSSVTVFYAHRLRSSSFALVHLCALVRSTPDWEIPWHATAWKLLESN